MLDKNVNDLELKLRIVKGEIRESKRKKEKSLEAVWSVSFCFITIIAIGFYFFFIKGEREFAAIILSVILLLLCPVLGFYWYHKYKSVCQKIEQLERELYLLKKGLKEQV